MPKNSPLRANIEDRNSDAEELQSQVARTGERHLKIAKALLRRAAKKLRGGEVKAAIADYDQLIDRFGMAVVLPMQMLIVEAYTEKATALIGIGQLQDAVPVLKNAIKLNHRFSEVIRQTMLDLPSGRIIPDEQTTSLFTSDLEVVSGSVVEQERKLADTLADAPGLPDASPMPGLEKPLDLLLASQGVTSPHTRRELIRKIAPLIAAAKPRPKRPKWKTRKGTDRNLTVPEFILKYHKLEIEAGTLTKATLRADRDLYRDFFAWQRHHKLPPELANLPTKKEWNDRQLRERGTPSRSEDIGLYEAARHRAAKPCGAARPGRPSSRRKTADASGPKPV
jgi:hypothetical protein